MPNGIQSLLEPIYGPEATPSSILSIFREGSRFTGRLEPLFGLAEEALGRIEPARAGQEVFARRGAIQSLIGQTRGFQAAQTRAGFAGGGALQRRRGLLGRETAGEFQERLFGIGQQAATARAGVQTSLLGGIQDVLAQLRAEGVEPSDIRPLPDPTTQEQLREDYDRYVAGGGDMNIGDWVRAGQPDPFVSDVDLTAEWEDYRARTGSSMTYEDFIDYWGAGGGRP